jgi:hypothetical protein
MQFIIFARKLGYWLVTILSAKREAEPQIVPTVFPRFFRAGTNVLIAQHTGCQGFEFEKLLTLKIAVQWFFLVVMLPCAAPESRRFSVMCLRLHKTFANPTHHSRRVGVG